MKKKAFSVIELAVVITLMGVMAILSVNYLNVNTLSKENTKTQLKSHINLITASILQCKDLSNAMPIQNDGSLANATLLSILECNTSTPYSLDADKGSFIPIPIKGFTPYSATQNGSEFYFSTSTPVNSTNDEVLKELQDDYSTRQYEYDATTASMKFYLSR